MKHILSLILIAAMMLVMAVPAAAIGPDVEWEDMDELMDVVGDAAGQLSEIDNASELAKGFKSFMGVAGQVGSVLGLINGSVAFLKLVGIMRDTTADNTVKILEQISIMNEKINQIDAKLDDLALELREMEATMELNNRGAKAYNMRLAWSRFSQDYVENGMEKLMTQYNAMLATGLMKWCANEGENARSYNGVDNTQIVILYGEDGKGGYAPVYSDCAPSAIADDCPRYAVLKADCLPDTFSYNADNFLAELTADIAGRIRTALDEENYEGFDSRGIPMLTPEGTSEITDEAIETLAADAANALVYRVGCAEVNASADFAYEVDRQFTNYCSHLFASEEGVDSMFKSFFLTHSFEFEVKDDLQDFCNRMILKTGTYGLFALNVLGMSRAAGDSMKKAAAARFYQAGMELENAKKSAFTDLNNFCYVTNTELSYTPLELTSSATIKVYHSGEVTAYRSYSDGPIRVEYKEYLPRGGLIGDAKALVLYYTLSTNGYNGRLHDYLRIRISPYDVDDYGPVVTSLGNEQTLALDDNTIRLQSRNAIGRYFPDGSTMTMKSLPEDAENEYIYGRRKLCGSTIDLDSGKLSINVPLHAQAVYGESNWYWFTDEAAALGGPAGRYGFSSQISLNKKGYDHTYSYSSTSKYGALFSIPLKKSSSLTSSDYDPLTSYTELWNELEDESQSFVNPPQPIEVPTVSGVEDIDLADTVWDAAPVDDVQLTDFCERQIEKAASDAGITLTAERKTALVQQIMAQYRAAEKRIAEDTSLYSEDPLGLGQNTEALWDAGKTLLPEYLLDETGVIGENVKYMFVRRCYQAIPSLHFNTDGSAEFVITYEVLPHLLVGETSAGMFQWLILPFDESKKTSFTETFPEQMVPSPISTDAPKEEVPPTGDDSNVLLYGVLTLLLPAATLLLWRKKSGKQ